MNALAIKEKIYKIAATGPFLIGWLFPILFFKPGSTVYRYALRSLFFTILYFMLLAFNGFFSFINFWGYGNYEDIGQSFYAFVYIAISLVQMVRIMQEKPALLSKNILFEKIPGENP